MPSLPEADVVRVETAVCEIAEVKEAQHQQSVFDDEDTRAFYEDLPELRAQVPYAQYCLYPIINIMVAACSFVW